MKDYYKILGVSKDATQEDIKKAYRRLAHKHHPDKGGSGDMFKEVSEAYQILSDIDKKAQYDKFGRVFDGSAGGVEGGEPGVGGFRWAWGAPGAEGASFDEDQGGFGFDFQEVGDIFDGLPTLTLRAYLIVVVGNLQPVVKDAGTRLTNV